jgi:hypothetical protein
LQRPAEIAVDDDRVGTLGKPAQLFQHGVRALCHIQQLAKPLLRVKRRRDPELRVAQGQRLDRSLQRAWRNDTRSANRGARGA